VGVAESQPVPAHPTGEERASPLELFFDLVFVLSFTQVTATMAEDPTWAGVGEGMLLLAAVWWAWAAYSWLTNAIEVDQTLNRLAMAAAMAAMLLVSLSLPEAFDDLGLLFGCSYFVVRAIHLLLYVFNTRVAGDDDNFGAIMKLAPGFLLAPALLIVAGALEGDARVYVWILALLIDFGTPLALGTAEFNLHPAHFAERYGLIIIIALGESLVAIGAGAGFELNAAEEAAALLGIISAFALWWAYFDIVAIVAERRLTEAPRGEQAPLARDSYSLLHFPMIAGIVLAAFGLKKVLGAPSEPLADIPAIALCGGVALYLAGHIAFRYRNVSTFNWHRTIAALVLLALIPLAFRADALVTLAEVTAVLVALIAYETIRFREARARVRENPQMSLAEMRGRQLVDAE
jgi:low temperature requirement protein LtrA